MLLQVTVMVLVLHHITALSGTVIRGIVPWGDYPVPPKVDEVDTERVAAATRFGGVGGTADGASSHSFIIPFYRLQFNHGFLEEQEPNLEVGAIA